jgi:hypothetical protein
MKLEQTIRRKLSDVQQKMRETHPRVWSLRMPF